MRTLLVVVTFVHLALVAGPDLAEGKKSYRDKCFLNEECDDTIGLECDYRHFCDCRSRYKWEEGECKKVLKDYLETCSIDSECTTQLICYKNKCMCPPDKDWSVYECVDANKQKIVNEECKLPHECLGDLNCDFLTNTCQCLANAVWKGREQGCTSDENGGKDEIDVNHGCGKSFRCKPPMECKVGVCTCPALSRWTGTSCSYVILISVVVVCGVLIAALVAFIVYRNMRNRRRRDAANSEMPMKSQPRPN